jgi:hypothetical protein
MNKRKINLKDRGDLKKNRFNFTSSTIFCLWVMKCFYLKDDSRQREFEENLVLFISHELVELALVEANFET